MIKTLICGSRSITEYGYVASAVSYAPFEPDMIITGGAAGVDNSGQAYAHSHSIDVKTVKPKYTEHGKRAPLKRNEAMVDEANTIIAVWNKQSNGTEYTIQYAKDNGFEEDYRKSLEDEIVCIYLVEDSVFGDDSNNTVQKKITFKPQ